MNACNLLQIVIYFFEAENYEDEPVNLGRILRGIFQEDILVTALFASKRSQLVFPSMKVVVKSFDQVRERVQS